jgi:hypothetical protein
MVIKSVDFVALLKSNLDFQQTVLKLKALIVKNLVAPKARVKHEFQFNKQASGNLAVP